jgi:hypothetical protein
MESVFSEVPLLSSGHDRPGEAVYGSEEERGFDRLGQKFHPSALNRIATAFFVRDEASEKENGNIPKSRIRRSLACEIAASFAWHVDIEQHDIRPELHGSGQGAKGFVNDHHFVLARIFEDHPGQARKVRIIIHN